MKERRPRAVPREAEGFALVAVLIVLVALFALAAPFLSGARDADAASQRLAEDAQARLALDAAGRHARAALAASHPAVDRTPAWDGEEELAVRTDFAPGFLDPEDTRGVMWDVEARDESGRIDPSSAPPQVFASLLGLSTRLARAAQADDASFVTASAAGLGPRGFGWIEGELVGWSERSGATLGGLARGLGSAEGAEGCAPRPASAHPLGALLVDETAHALARWRFGPEGLRGFDGPDRLAEAAATALGGGLSAERLGRLARATSVHAGAGAWPPWQRAARVLEPVQGGQTCRLVVDDGRWFNPGTSVEVRGAEGSELRLVHAARGGVLELSAPLELSYGALEATVRPLARRPVNLNSAPPEVLQALFENLELAGSSGWITPSEARRLAAAVQAARPLAGFEDFLRRVVLPAAGLEAPAGTADDEDAAGGEAFPPVVAPGEAFLQRDDAIALYKNGLNANDADLAFSTMPFAFVSRDAYALELRAVVNAESGAARSLGLRDEHVLVAPQRELLSLWTRQSELDGATRLSGAASGWTSGPANTLRHDPLQARGRPSDARAHLGWLGRGLLGADPDEPPPAPEFAGREPDGWMQLAPLRADGRDTDALLREGRVLHFDDEPSGPEGRALPSEPLRLDPAAEPVEWLDAEGLLAPFVLEGWVRLRSGSAGTRLLDLAGPFRDSDRVTLEVEADGLVLHVLGPAEDHPETEFEEKARLRYPLDEPPGLPLDTWAHLALDVRGDRADQIAFLVDGRPVPDVRGRTRLAADVSLADLLLPVESTEGFPERCVLRIGRELVEAVVEDERTFNAAPHDEGELAGFGGRLAREIVFGAEPPTNLGEVEKGGSHREGETVSLYGYSLPLAAHVPAGEGRLAGELGAFAVARAVGVTGVSPEPIFLQLNEAQPTNIGWGMKGRGSGVDGLLLDVADPGADLEEVLAAFPEKGGYALLLGFFEEGGAPATSEGDPLSTLEVVRYGRREGNRLVLDRRGDALVELPELAAAGLNRRSAFLVDWSGGVSVDGSALDPDERMELATLVVPLSIPAEVRAGGVGFYDSEGQSDFCQLTRLGGDAHRTEWVRYDEVTAQHLVRDDAETLRELRRRAHPLQPRIRAVIDEVDDPTGIGNEQAVAAGAGPPPAAGQGAGDPVWEGALGEAEDAELPLTRALGSVLAFRGVLGTASHAHPAGTPVLPVWKVTAPIEESGGWPGRLDAVALFDGDPAQPGFPAVVQHAHRPFDTVHASWVPGKTPLSTEAGPSSVEMEEGFDLSVTYVALQGPLEVPIVPGAAAAGTGLAASTVAQVSAESRLNARVTLFPSGELPRAVTALAVGGDALSTGEGPVPDAEVDELVFARPRERVEDGGSQLVLAEALDAEGAAVLRVEPDRLLVPHGLLQTGQPVSSGLSGDALLFAVGDELLCAEPDPGGRFVLGPGRRGLLGTQARPHAEGEPVSFLAGWPVALLSATVGPEDALLPLEDAEGFPPEGLVLVGAELVHYTRVLGSTLAMPRASLEPGREDGRGTGLFRGRFGTTPARHDAGAPVVLFPERYPDRWAERADAPELACFELCLSWPTALYRQVFWSVEEPAAGGPRLEVLQRSREEVSWDAEPALRGPFAEGRGDAPLVLFGDELDPGQGLPLALQADRVEWRVFARHDPGSFDPEQRLSHAWKGTPRLTAFGVDWLAPHVLLGSVER